MLSVQIFHCGETQTSRDQTVWHTGSGLTLRIRICLWVSFVSCRLSVCKADVFLSLSKPRIKLWHVAKKVGRGVARFRGSVPCMCKSRSSRITQIHQCPPPSPWMPCGNRPGPHSRFEKRCSQPSQKQSCIKRPADTLTNNREFKTTASESGSCCRCRRRRGPTSHRAFDGTCLKDMFW